MVDFLFFFYIILKNQLLEGKQGKEKDWAVPNSGFLISCLRKYLIFLLQFPYISKSSLPKKGDFGMMIKIKIGIH